MQVSTHPMLMDREHISGPKPGQGAARQAKRLAAKAEANRAFYAKTPQPKPGRAEKRRVILPARKRATKIARREAAAAALEAARAEMKLAAGR